MRSFLEKRPAFGLDEAARAAPILRGYAEGKKRPTVQIIKVVDKNGRVYELFAKKDAKDRETIQIRDPSVKRKSPNVIAKDVAFKACMKALDEVVKSKAEGGKGSGLDYNQMAEVREYCMVQLYDANKSDIISKVQEMLGKESPKAIIDSLYRNYTSMAERLIEDKINELRAT